MTSQPNSASTWKKFNFDIDFTQNITLLSNDILQLSLSDNINLIYNSIDIGDSLYLNNFFVGTSSVFDFSGQYVVNQVSSTSSIIQLDVSSNTDLVSYGNNVLPLMIHSSTASMLSNKPYFSLNKGYIIKLTRINSQDQIDVSEKYLIDVRNIEY